MELETKWIELFNGLNDDPNFRDRIAAPFLSVPPEDARSILYIGKATSGEWYKHDYLCHPSLHAREKTSKRQDRREARMHKTIPAG